MHDIKNLKSKEALSLAREAIRNIKPDDNICSDNWTAVSQSACARCYYFNVVKPIGEVLGSNRQTLFEETCIKYWNNEYLVRLLLVQLDQPTPDAFSLFKKAGNTNELKTDRTIATAEYAVWKKARRLKEFRTEYPERYKLAAPIKSGSKQSAQKKRTAKK